MKKLFTFLFIVSMSIISLSAQQVFFESFENPSTMPSGWTQDQVTGSAVWYNGLGATVGNNPYNGSYYTGYWGSTGGSICRLISAPIYLTSTNSYTLSFYYVLSIGSSLEVFYKTSASAQWQPLVTNLSSASSWTLKTVTIPTPAFGCYISFLGTSIGGDDMSVDAISIDEVITTTIPEEEKQQQQIYPNPSNGLFYIDNLTTCKTIKVFNTFGEQVFYRSNFNANNVIDLTQKPKGIYFVQQELTNGQKRVEKILVE